MEKEQFEIRDKSGDRRCFTIVPNYILNHSTGDEQALYLQMKRLAGEDGECFATQESLGKKLGWDRKKTGSVIKLLLKRKWLKETGTKVLKTSPVKTYEIVDIWILNNKFYPKKRRVQNTPISEKEKRGESKRLVRGESKTLVEEEPNIKKIPKVRLDKPTKEPFSFKTYLTDLIGNKRRDIHIIGLYWQYKGFVFVNNAQCSAALKRELRPVKNLVGYLDDRILEVMDWLESNTDMKWTLETIHKFVDEDLDNLEPFNNKGRKNY